MQDAQMTIEELLERARRCRNKAEIIKFCAQADVESSSINSEYFYRFVSLLSSSDRNRMLAEGLALAKRDSNDLIARLRRSGSLRASRRSFQSGGIVEFVGALLELSALLGIESERVRYLESVRNLCSIAPNARKVHLGIIERLRRRPGIALKSFLALANQVFAHPREPDPSASTDDLSHYSAEDFAEAVSRLITIHRDAFGLGPNDLALTDPQAVNPLNSTFKRDLLDALHLEAYCRAEVLIDGLPYKAEALGSGVVVAAIDPDFEKATRFGYVQTMHQVRIRMHRAYQNWAPGERANSLETLFQQYGETLDGYARVVEEPARRVVFAIPEIDGMFAPLASDPPYWEELLMLLQLDVERYGENDEANFEVAEGVSSTDLFKVMRLFAFVAYIVSREIEAQPESERARLTLNSIIPVMAHGMLLALVERIVPTEIARRIIDLLTLGPSDRVDLQYKPLVFAGGLYFIAPALIARSNLVRNILRAHDLADVRSGGIDDMQNAASDALRQAGFLVATEVSVSTNPKKPEIDIVALRGEDLYVFECKSSYHPCNPHELRNSYAHLKKGGEQLTKRANWLSDASRMKQLFDKLDWQKPDAVRVHTCVLMANRVLAGIKVEGHPVRQAHELINVLLRGTIESPQVRLRFWKDETFSNDDLDLYLSEDGLVKDHFDSMARADETTLFGGKSLTFESYAYETAAEENIFRRRYTEIPAAAADSET